jgi:hypothetical protein
VLAASPAPADARPDLGAPRFIRTAKAPDALPRPRSVFEEWSLHLVDPRSRALLLVDVDRAPDRTSGTVYAFDGRRPLEVQTFALGASARDRLSWVSPSGRLEMIRGRRGWRVRLETGTARARFRVTRTRAGVTARRWRLGRDGLGHLLHISWSAPVAVGRVRGSFEIDDPYRGPVRFKLGGWRATLEHSWGYINRTTTYFIGWEHAAVHERHGGTWLIHGLNRLDLLTGPGARDAFWLGLLVRVDRHGARVCRPLLARRYPYEPDVRTTTMRARCPGARLVLRVMRGTDYGTEGDWTEIESRVATRPRGFGWWRSVENWPF